MPSYVPVVKNGANGAVFYVCLSPQTPTGSFQSNPTLASGDVTISKDGGAFANLTTLPDVEPNSSKAVRVILSQTETNADNLVILFSDASGAQWCDLMVNIQTVARQIDDLAFPTVSGRSIDVATGGEVGLDWANIGSPTTSQTLSGTTVGTATTVTNMVTANVTQISGDATAADNLESAADGTGYNLGGGLVVAASVTGNVGGNVTGSVGSVSGNVAGNVTGTVASVVGNVGGNVTGSVGSVVANVGVGSLTAGAVADFFTVDSGETYADAVAGSVVFEIADNAGGGAAPTVQQIVDGVWDEPIAAHLDTGSTGEALNAAGGSGDPWITTLPGAYSAGQAGFIIGTYLDAAITDVPDAVLTETDGVETGYSLQGALRVVLAAMAGKASGFTGAPTDTVTYRDVNDTTDRIVAGVTEYGNRTSVTVDPS